MTLKVANFMSCCGIQIIHNFLNNSEFSMLVSVKKTEKELRNIVLKGWFNPLDTNSAIGIKPYNFAMQLVVLNTYQHDKFHKMMIKNNFQLIDKGWNLNHRNMNYLYSLHLEEGKKEYKLK